MKKITKTYHTARKLVLALAILAGAGAALWKLSENRRLKKQYMDTWQADAAKVRKAVAGADEPAVQAATTPTATIPETEAERCAECDWEQDTGAV
ncbi:hypothetical protein LJC60_04730 [Ruminococcaceae bacterium OttesenSCG-928-D13]|nr:hypothetical protein [Ruminococcaceae bacterium OttesenSCG-928-D13]